MIFEQVIDWVKRAMVNVANSTVNTLNQVAAKMEPKVIEHLEQIQAKLIEQQKKAADKMNETADQAMQNLSKAAETAIQSSTQKAADLFSQATQKIENNLVGSASTNGSEPVNNNISTDQNLSQNTVPQQTEAVNQDLNSTTNVNTNQLN